MKQNIEIKIDYLSVTFPLKVDSHQSTKFKVQETVIQIADYLNVKNFETIKTTFSQNGYKEQFMLGENIILRLDGPENSDYQKTCQLELKGEGCREYERRNPEKTWVEFLLYIINLNGRFKRIDIAIDDYEGNDITMQWLLDKATKKQYTSVFKSPVKPIGTLKTGLTLQFGSNSSNTELVIYDKQKEQQSRGKSTQKDYWIRFELRFRNDNAKSIAFKIINEMQTNDETYGANLQQLAFEQLYRVIDFKVDNDKKQDQQKKLETHPKWIQFLNNVEKGNLAKPTETQSTFESYLKASIPYIVSYLIIIYLKTNKDINLFNLEIYKLFKDNLEFSKRRFQKLNIYLDGLNIKPINDKNLSEIEEELTKLIEDSLLPF